MFLESLQKFTSLSLNDPKVFPHTLTKNEILSILDVIKNHKHRTLIALAYGAGLRVSEVVALRVQDINIASRVLTIRLGKGQKDRISLLPPQPFP